MENLGETLAAYWQDSYVQLIMLLTTIGLLWLVGRCQPSARTFWLLAIPIAVLSLGFFIPGLTLFFQLYNPALCILLLIDRFLLAVQPERLQVSRSLSNRFSIRSPNHVALTVVNQSPKPVLVRLADAYPQNFQLEKDSQNIETEPTNQWQWKNRKNQPETLRLAPYERETWNYALRAFRRGRFRFGKIHLSYLSPLGLLWIQTQGGREEDVQVHPDLKQIQKIRLKYSRSLSTGELQKRRMGSEGTQFDSLRTYAAGDDLKKMDWRATARLDAPILRTFTHEVEQPILILLDAGRKMQTETLLLTKFDWALNAALAFAGVAIDRGDQVGVGVFHQEMIVNLPFATGKKHLKFLLDELSGLQAHPIEPDYEAVMLQAARSLKKRAFVIIFTDLIDPMASKSLIKSLQAFSRNHLLTVVTFNDRELIKFAEQVPQQVFDAYEKGVSLDLLELRRQTLLQLAAHHNATVIDTTPDRMDEALVNHYLSLKLRNRL